MIGRLISGVGNIRHRRYDIPKMVAVLEKLEGACRHGDPGSRAVIDFLEGF